MTQTTKNAVVNLGYAIHMQGRIDEAIKWHRKAAKSEAHSAIGNYNLGCVYSIREDTEKALEHLDLAMESGLHRWLGHQHLEEDSDLDHIRSDERFEDLIEEMEALQHRFTGFQFHMHSDADEGVWQMMPTELFRYGAR